MQAGADQIPGTSNDGWTCGTPVEVVMNDPGALLAVEMNGGGVCGQSHSKVRRMALCSIQACRHLPIDVLLADLPVLDCGGGQLP